MYVFAQSRRWDISAVEIIVNSKVFLSVLVKSAFNVHAKDYFPEGFVRPVTLRVTPHSFELFDYDEYPWVSHIHVKEEIPEVFLAYLFYENSPHDLVLIGNVYAIMGDVMWSDIYFHLLVSPLVRRWLFKFKICFVPEQCAKCRKK